MSNDIKTEQADFDEAAQGFRDQVIEAAESDEPFGAFGHVLRNTLIGGVPLCEIKADPNKPDCDDDE